MERIARLLRRAREELRSGRTAHLERTLRRSLQEVRALGGHCPQGAEEVLEAMRSLEGEIRERLAEACRRWAALQGARVGLPRPWPRPGLSLRA